jgi:hypothetical protein
VLYLAAWIPRNPSPMPRKKSAEMLPVMPLRSTVVYPSAAMSVQIGMEPTIAMLEAHPEEALEVADEIVVINEGRVEQIGTPDQLYDQPANDFVMRFLGPVTQLGDRLVRPHDLQLTTGPATGGASVGRVTRRVQTGFVRGYVAGLVVGTLALVGFLLVQVR